MARILDITRKDLTQLLRDYKTFMFLLIMPVTFTLLFGYASGAFSAEVSDSRLPVGYLNLDDRWVDEPLRELLDSSETIRLVEIPLATESDLEALVADEKLAAAVIVPHNYGQMLLKNKTVRLTVIADTDSTSWTTIQAEILTAISRVDGAIRTATIMDDLLEDRTPFRYAFDQTLEAWDEPPIKIVETTSSVVPNVDDNGMSLAHTSPGMMVQFAIAGLLTSAQIIVAERKSRTFQRLLTTSARRIHILTGHYLAIFTMIGSQFMILIAFGQIILKVEYMRAPAATLLVACSAAACIAAMGLLIGLLAKNEEQAVVLSIVPMFVFAGAGGAWVPLEVTGETFQFIGHLTPVAWAMDGFKNVVVRGFGFESALLPSGALFAYGLIFLVLAIWKLQTTEER